MFSFKKPSSAEIEELVPALLKADFNYGHVGITQELDIPNGYNRDHNRILLGHGSAVFQSACEAVRNWVMFDLGWVRQVRRREHVPIQVGSIAVVQSYQLGLYTTLCSRIVRVIEESGDVERFGFAYGTLPVHVEAGEERFLIEWQKSDDAVYYDVLAYSKPFHWLTKISYPYARYCQKRFGRDSKQRMFSEVQQSLG